MGVRLVWARFEWSTQRKAICSNTAEREQVASRNAFASDRPGGSRKGRFALSTREAKTIPRESCTPLTVYRQSERRKHKIFYFEF